MTDIKRELELEGRLNGCRIRAERAEAELAAAIVDRDKYLNAFSEQFDQRVEYADECRRLWTIENQLEQLIRTAESGAGSWGACAHEWLRIDELKAVLGPGREETEDD